MKPPLREINSPHSQHFRWLKRLDPLGSHRRLREVPHFEVTMGACTGLEPIPVDIEREAGFTLDSKRNFQGRREALLLATNTARSQCQQGPGDNQAQAKRIHPVAYSAGILPSNEGKAPPVQLPSSLSHHREPAGV
ncbi:unnamed protein product [Pleuronectes platessa]|uniref:Uncharacterized protein n=1 Tax=Pleuronectes platessa TaxID=8262 RepID=A0A9N7TW50_PLEPL|nr:unnamed protein product [Pleuronectes platessa]